MCILLYIKIVLKSINITKSKYTGSPKKRTAALMGCTCTIEDPVKHRNSEHS